MGLKHCDGSRLYIFSDTLSVICLCRFFSHPGRGYLIGLEKKQLDSLKFREDVSSWMFRLHQTSKSPVAFFPSHLVLIFIWMIKMTRIKKELLHTNKPKFQSFLYRHMFTKLCLHQSSYYIILNGSAEPLLICNMFTVHADGPLICLPFWASSKGGPFLSSCCLDIFSWISSRCDEEWPSLCYCICMSICYFR